MNTRVNTPISTQELERRWAAVRVAMSERGIDALLMQNNNDHMGGYVKYFTDLPATNGYPVAVVFPRDDLMTMVRQGPFGGVQEGSDGVRRGLKRMLMTPSYASAPYTNDYDGELAATALMPYVRGTIGLVGSYQMSHALVDYLRRNAFASTRFVDASDLVDRIKVIKSAEEMDRCRDTARIQDAAMRAAFDAIRPGMTDSQVAAVAQHYCHSHGCEQGIYLAASWTPGSPAPFGGWHMGGRTLREGDCFTLLVESNGPGGFYTELGRTAVLGKVPDSMQEELAFVREARQVTLDLLRPGNAPADIWNQYNSFMERHGRPPEARLHSHGQGYDMVERPLIRHDEPLAIQAGMNIVVHPTYTRSGAVNWLCDNYFVGADGAGDRLHAFPEQIVSL